VAIQYISKTAFLLLGEALKLPCLNQTHISEKPLEIDMKQYKTACPINRSFIYQRELRKQSIDDLPQEVICVIGQAGLVLLHVYLQRFFGYVGLIKAGQFKGLPEQQKKQFC